MSFYGQRYIGLLVAMLFCVTASAKAQAQSSAKTSSVPVPLRDPADIAFRRAPMAESSRSIAVPLSTNLHLAFDAALLRTHTVWTGQGLSLYGEPFHGRSDRFICTPGGPIQWQTAPLFPWSTSVDASDQQTSGDAKFKDIDVKDSQVSLDYEITVKQQHVQVRETPLATMLGDCQTVIRRFSIGSCNTDLIYLAHTAPGKATAGSNPDSVLLDNLTNQLLVVVKGPANLKWQPVTKQVNYDQVLCLDQPLGAKGPYRTNHINRMEGRAYLHIPAHSTDIQFEIITTILPAGSKSEKTVELVESALKSTVPPKSKSSPPLFEVSGDASMPPRFDGDKYYRVEHFPLPKEINLMITGMDWLSNGDLAVCTWPGDVYIVKKPQDDVRAARYQRFARGLNEPLGLKVVRDQIYVTEKAQLTRLTDTDKNGEADLFENFNSDWSYTGNYHAFVFGPVTDKAGNFFVYTTGNHGVYDAPHLGWCMQISPDGKRSEPFCSGLRSPNGYGTYGPDQDLFMTDNEGNWIGAGKLNHLQKGRFYGYPSTLPAPRWHYENPTNFAPPAVWFPMSLAKSSSGITTIADDRFGPFTGQMLVGDYQNSIVTRVMLEKVNGEWQGAAWPFAKGFLSGVNRLAYGSDGKLYVGGCKGGHWSGAVGPKNYSLERVYFTGMMPFEIKEVHARPDGFELVYTKLVEPTSAGNVQNYSIEQFTFQYHEKYGSPQVDHDGREKSASEIKVAKAIVSRDRLKVQLVLEGLKEGFVTSISALDVVSAEDDALWHDTLFYTLNSIPR